MGIGRVGVGQKRSDCHRQSLVSEDSLRSAAPPGRPEKFRFAPLGVQPGFLSLTGGFPKNVNFPVRIPIKGMERGNSGRRGVAERSEFSNQMIAGGNHTISSRPLRGFPKLFFILTPNRRGCNWLCCTIFAFSFLCAEYITKTVEEFPFFFGARFGRMEYI